jgi:hypothetical protein
VQTLTVCVFDLFLLQIVRLLLIDNVLSSVEIDFVRLDASAAGENHVSKEHDNVQRNSKVAGNEVLIVKIETVDVDEDVEVLCQTNENDKGQGDDGTPESLRGDIGHGRIGDVLGAASTEEEEISDKDGNPSQDAEDSNKVNEVAKDLIIMSK